MKFSYSDFCVDECIRAQATAPNHHVGKDYKYVRHDKHATLCPNQSF